MGSHAIKYVDLIRKVQKRCIFTALSAIVVGAALLMGIGPIAKADSSQSTSLSMTMAKTANGNSQNPINATEDNVNYAYYGTFDWYLKPTLSGLANWLYPFDSTAVPHSQLCYVEVDSTTGISTVLPISPYPDFPAITGYHIDGQNNSHTWSGIDVPKDVDVQAYLKAHPSPVYYLSDPGIPLIIPIIATVVGVGALVNQATNHSSTGPTPTPNPAESSSASDVVSSSSSSAESQSSDVNQTPTNPDLASKGEVVYGIKHLYMYNEPTFAKSARAVSYARKPLINRPMFVVTGYSGSQYYQVRDVNHGSATYGRKGYITTNAKYVIPVYYGSMHRQVTVVNPKGVNAYRNADLSSKVKNYRQGTVIKVYQLVNHNLTTRFYIGNGQYITANKKMVFAGTYKQPKSIKVTHAIYLYKDLNLTQRRKLVKKGTVLKVKKWDYTVAKSASATGSKRYLVAGGYVTANPRFVKVIQ